MLHKFRRDPYFLLKYNLANFAVVGSTLALGAAATPAFEGSKVWFLAMAVFMAPNFFVIVGGGSAIFLAFVLTGGLEGRLWPLALPVLALYAAFLSALFMHNTAHGNVRPRWLNRLVGEFVGFHQLGGYANWTIVHLIHHQHPDHPEKDPHPPGRMPFVTYMRTMFDALIRCINAEYRERFVAKDARLRGVWLATALTGVTVRYGRTALMFALLGPTWFACFFAPFYVLLTVVYWHFNYATHRPTANGVAILNLDHNAYYRVTNFLFAGCYFHKNHHEQPNRFDASRVVPRIRAAAALRQPRSS